MGVNHDTLKIIHNGISYIKFKDRKLIEQIQDKNFYITIVGKANMNNWRGRLTPQIFIEDCEIEYLDTDNILDF